MTYIDTDCIGEVSVDSNVITFSPCYRVMGMSAISWMMTVCTLWMSTIMASTPTMHLQNVGEYFLVTLFYMIFLHLSLLIIICMHVSMLIGETCTRIGYYVLSACVCGCQSYTLVLYVCV